MNPIVRPTVLTVLCIFTFLNSMSGLWVQSERLWNPGVAAYQMHEMLEAARDKIEKQSSEADAKIMDPIIQSVIDSATREVMQKGAVVMIIFESLSLYGAYLMWNLKKRGFYLYLAGIAVAFFGSLLIVGGWLGVFTAIAGVLLSSVMCIIYAFNLKHLH
ncbi:hypothetical protein [Dyadobacter sp. CY356]|uniref:hypothetical protein n=1 Tax=Dyadobacter sp. CY356 TaxID=2906442 RepID=UPI001F42413A|nr:hypothetical protein [Dyadobacter sp. CY356]MCF0058141.1 hypothetical protein [Dyadobacter sp. CY356]